MPMTNAEKKQAQRDREADALKALSDTTYPYLKQTFSEWVPNEAFLSDFDLPLELAGITPPTFKDERSPQEFVLDNAKDAEDPFPGAEGAIGRAEVIIDCLIDAATELASVVNTYKKQEINNRLSELENSDTADRATAMKEAVKLNKILDQLDKQVRRNFPQWRISGV